MKPKTKILSSGLLGALCFSSLPNSASADSVVLDWNNAALEAIRDTHPGPPMVARMLAVAHTCMFDAWAAYDEKAKGTRLGGKLRRPAAERTLANKNMAVSHAAHRCLSDLFPSETAKFDALMTGLGYNPADDSTDQSTPAGIGNLAANAVIEFRHHDGANQLGDLHPGAYSDYTGYQPVNTPDTINDPNRWQPLAVPDGQGGFVTQQFIAPHWGLVAPYAMKDGAQFRKNLPAPAYYDPSNPSSPDSRRFILQAQQILDYTAYLSDSQKVIAEYWADGPSSELPPGHWALFAQYVSHRDHYNLDKDVKLFFALTNAIFDAGIAAWDAKRAFDYVRPVTAIHYLFAGQTVQGWSGPVDGAGWQPYQAPTVVTPPFAEYYSGHSVFSAAGAETLKRFTGSDAFGMSVTVPAGSSRVEPGVVPATDVTLYWATFSDAADEAGISRRYGGIHFIDGDLNARKLGRDIAGLAWKLSQKYFRGE